MQGLGCEGLHRAELADAAILIEDKLRVAAGSLAVGMLRRLRGVGVSLVLVLVVTDVPGGGGLFVLAIGRSRRPGELARQQNQQENREPAAHVRPSIRAK